VIFLAGPTNSGKTYHGLNLLARFSSGVYLAPLRLLALEGQEELFKRGVKASFLTGEERDIIPDARFTASTIEMLNLHQEVEAALIDEIQLLADRGRGWAWTQAFVGVPARTVILTGSANALPLVQRLAEYTEEEVEVREFSRLTPLEPILSPQSIDRPEPGTAFIAFSRRDVLELREHLRTSGFPASVIYGNLSPDVRREEARRFRSGETRFVVATDAIGMGLNLPIQKVVFHTLSKFDGRDPRPLTDAELLQIAGRAGRYQQYPVGYAGALEAEDARRVAQVLRSGILPPPREKVFVQPTADFILALRGFLPGASFLDALLLFRSKMRFDDSFIVPVVTDDMFELARMVDEMAARKRAYREQVEELFQWICAPVDTKTPEMVAAYQDCLRQFLAGDPVHPRKIVKLGMQINNNYDLLQAEISVKVLTLYCWLGYRYQEIFPDLQEAEKMRGLANRSIEKALLHKKLGRACANCGKPLPPLFQFPICERCYRHRSFRWEKVRQE
jgi:ATP-dependent RNA helicase SUPV3L1/SUV3